MDVRMPILPVGIVVKVTRRTVVAARKSKTEPLSSGNQDGRLSVQTLRGNERRSTHRQCNQEKFFHSSLPFLCCLEGGTLAKTFHDASGFSASLDNLTRWGSNLKNYLQRLR